MKQRETQRSGFDFDDFSVKLLLTNAIVVFTIALIIFAIFKR